MTSNADITIHELDELQVDLLPSRETPFTINIITVIGINPVISVQALTLGSVQSVTVGQGFVLHFGG